VRTNTHTNISHVSRAEQASAAVTLQINFRKGLLSNPKWVIGYCVGGFAWFISLPVGKYRNGCLIKPPQIPYKSYAIHHLPHYLKLHSLSQRQLRSIHYQTPRRANQSKLLETSEGGWENIAEIDRKEIGLEAVDWFRLDHDWDQ
jgi:hypothetical protein